LYGVNYLPPVTSQHAPDRIWKYDAAGVDVICVGFHGMDPVLIRKALDILQAANKVIVSVLLVVHTYALYLIVWNAFSSLLLNNLVCDYSWIHDRRRWCQISSFMN
jgi:hypothetical protein